MKHRLYRLDALAGYRGAPIFGLRRNGVELALDGWRGESRWLTRTKCEVCPPFGKVHLFIAYLITQDLGRVRG